ncbi:ABC transporter substrate-binding protein [Roseomonas aerophila]|uniref:ABC transporter substrate-binding protein n=1 Tax=Teichococcus aerophilus TaxID=1224513 RepID=A0ABR7RLL2_9PROT|nr:ABC transporter substrate-binding protein [Pseudoroseomonas aerophila]
MITFKRLATAGIVLSLAPAALAQDLRMGVALMTTSMDPHWHNLGSNNGLLQQVYEPLILEDHTGALQPRLATAWRAVDDTTWEITLREGVRFQDGTPFTPEDVAFTLARVPQVQGSPGPFTAQTRPITGVEVTGPLTLRLRTAAPHPLLPRDLSYVMMLSRHLHAGKTPEDFNAGTAAIGTGPYRFSSYAPGEALTLARFDGYWGGPQPWTRVTIRQLRQDSARVAAVLSGDVDVIDRVPLQDLERLRRDRRLAIASAPAAETYYLFLDAVREATPFVTARDGGALPVNPLRDPKVRQALSMAINRDGIVERVMDGSGTPAGQLVAPGVDGAAPDLRPLPYDPATARRLLAEAGYPEGFAITLHGSAGFVVNDDRVLQSVAQMLSRIGVLARVETFPANVLLPRAGNREFSAFFSSWIASTAVNPLRALVATRDAARGMGPANRQHYSNPAVDTALGTALVTLDDTARNAQLGQAMRLAIADAAIIPVIHPANNWATVAARVTYTANPLGRNQAMLARPAEGKAPTSPSPGP